MKGDFSRSTFDILKHYIGVRMQQGRVQLDADWNENLDILLHRIETETIDVIGECGVPIHDAAFGIVTAFKDLSKDEKDWLTEQGFDELPSWEYFLTQGRAYVDGILVENEHTLPIDWQPHFLPHGASPPAPGTYLLFLDVWQRHITALEDPSIREVALGGPDTTTRMQTIWQARAKKVGDVGDVITCADDLSPWPGPSKGKLRARTHPEDQPDDPCTVAPGAGYNRLENQLYRVEIHKPSNMSGGPSFKWSRDNGSIVVKIEEFKVGGAVKKVRVNSLGRDEVLRLHEQDWVEVIDDASELAGFPGMMAQIVKIEPDNVLTLSEDVSGYTLGWYPKVRRWESGKDIPVTVPATNGGYIKLEGNIEIKFDIDVFHTGDYWLIPARTVPTQFGDIEWPQVDGDPAALLPLGILHHYCKLAIYTAAEKDGKIIITLIDDCRKKFPPLTELPAGGQDCCSVSVGEGGNFPDIQSALKARPVDAQEWQICWLAGTYKLEDTVEIDDAQALTISGCGRQTHLTGPEGKPAFIFTGGNGVRLENLQLDASSPDGAILFMETKSVAVNDCVLANRVLDLSDKTKDLTAKGLSALLIHMSETVQAEIRKNDLYGLPAILADGLDISIVGNRIQGGGIQIMPPSSSIQIEDNLIYDGQGPGIRLGANVVIFDSAMWTEDTGARRSEQPAAGAKSPMVGVFLVKIRNNVIDSMDGSGIVTQTAMQDLSQMSDVEDLMISDNVIIGCCAEPDVFLSAETNVGAGIALLAVYTAQITDNFIAWNGAGDMPACGIFLLEGGDIHVDRNIIAENGVATNEDAPASYQAGIAAHFMFGDVIGAATQASGLQGYPALRIRGNEVTCPAGQALTLSALGGVMVDGNTFVTRARKQQPTNPLLFGEKGACVYVLDLGIPNWLKEALP